jgi:hypothetical protein
MKIVLYLLMIFPPMALAQWSFDNSGSRVFDMSKNIAKKTTIELKYVDSKDLSLIV